jgi:uncharacterized hydrophobic protein (TIGR00271 family)
MDINFRMLALRQYVARLFSLNEDKADNKAIDQALRAGVEMRGSNLWVLIFAIFVASIGLNVNSTAVVIGAMLISPLMGPIMGAGYGIGIYDFMLVRRSLKNLGIAAFIGLCTSTLYFLVSPLAQVQSELLSRTTPTIWDVLIALFGGLAGIIGATRKEKSNVIPGVAIATALMPPLCTAGFGLANQNWYFFGGAFYLFAINCIFIALGSAFVIRIFHVERKVFVDQKKANRVKILTSVIVVLTVIPSIYLAYMLVQQELFKSKAALFIDHHVATNRTFVTQSLIDPKSKRLVVTMVGKYITPQEINLIAKQLPTAGLPEATLDIRQQADPQHIDVNSLKNDLLSDLYAKSQASLEKNDLKIKVLQDAIIQQHILKDRMLTIPQELHELFPQVTEIWLADATNWTLKTGIQPNKVTVVNVKSSRNISRTDREKITKWLQTRLSVDTIKLFVETKKNHAGD